MRILYVYPKNEPLIARHVAMLMEELKLSATLSEASDATTFRQQMQSAVPDILHIHGCNGILRYVRQARARGVRVVLTPHSQIEQAPRTAIPLVYAIISLGKIEHQRLQQTGLNPRIEEIRNAVTTNTTSPRHMAISTFALYQKVMDSDTLSQMDERTQAAMAQILKAGITGDRRWIQQPPRSEEINWRHLLIYAEHEGVRHLVDYGISLLGLSTPALDTTRIQAFFPQGYSRPQSIKTLIGDYQGNQTDYLRRMIRQTGKSPLLLHLTELTRELYRDSADDGLLAEALEEADLTATAQRLMQILSEQTLLDEGYMPLPPINDRHTRQLRAQIANHLKI